MILQPHFYLYSLFAYIHLTESHLTIFEFAMASLSQPSFPPQGEEFIARLVGEDDDFELRPILEVSDKLVCMPYCKIVYILLTKVLFSASASHHYKRSTCYSKEQRLCAYTP